MLRIATAILTVVLVTLASYGVRFLAPPEAVAATGGSVDPIELGRLIGVFAQRVADQGDAVNAAHLGAHLSIRAKLTGSLDDYRTARSAFELAAGQWPSRDALVGLANTSMALHDFGAGLAAATELLELDAGDPAAHLIVGDAWLELGDIDRAVESFNRSADAAPGDPALVVRRAEVAHLTGNQELAIDLAEEAHRLAARQNLSARGLAFYPLLRADFLFDAGDYAAAQDQVAEAMDLAPGWAPIHASDGKVLAALGDFDGAVAAYLRALTLQPDDPGWLASLGDLASVTGQVAAADGYYRLATALYAQEDPAIYGQSLARLYADRDVEPMESVRLASDDLDRRTTIGSYDTYGWALFRSGRLEDARAASDTALRFGTQDGELWFHAAMISAALGETDRAIAELGSLIETNPEFHPVHAIAARRLLESLRSS